MGEPGRQYQPVNLQEFKRRLLARAKSSSEGLPKIHSQNSPGSSADTDASFLPMPILVTRLPQAAERLSRRRPRGRPKPIPGLCKGRNGRPRIDRSLCGRRSAVQWSCRPRRRRAMMNGARHEDGAPYGNEDLLVAPGDDAHLRLRNRKRANTSLFVTAAALRDGWRPCGSFRSAGRFCGLAAGSSCRYRGCCRNSAGDREFGAGDRAEDSGGCRRPGRRGRRCPAVEFRRSRCRSPTRGPPPRRRRLRRRIRRHLRKTRTCFCSRDA